MSRDLYPRPRRRDWAGEVAVLVAKPPPRLADLEAALAAKGIVNLGPKPLSKCGTCKALAPNHRVDCELIVMPDPDAPKCGSCPYSAGSLGCRMACGGRR